MQPPIPNLGPNGFCGLVGNRGREVDKELSFPVLRSSRAERVSQKIEFVVRIISSSIIILAIDNLRLLGMKLQPTVFQSIRNCCTNFLGLAFRSAMHDGIIGVSLE